jgi:GxxExxY protein
MPVSCEMNVHPIDQQSFYDIDQRVMGRAFSAHNELGNFVDEAAYSRQMAGVLAGEGVDVCREVCVRLSHKDFAKLYFIDCIAEKSAVYEFKAVSGLNADHKAQGINYLLNQKTAWHISSLYSGLDYDSAHLQKFPSHTELNQILWANLDRHNVTVTMLKR